jgi:hypothetical protein
VQFLFWSLFGILKAFILWWHLFPKIWEIIYHYIVEHVSMPLACSSYSSMPLICRFGLLVVSQRSCMFCSLFIILIFSFYCVNVLIQLFCPQGLVVWLLLDLVYWWGFQMSVFDFLSFLFIEFQLDLFSEFQFLLNSYIFILFYSAV